MADTIWGTLAKTLTQFKPVSDISKILEPALIKGLDGLAEGVSETSKNYTTLPEGFYEGTAKVTPSPIKYISPIYEDTELSAAPLSVKPLPYPETELRALPEASFVAGKERYEEYTKPTSVVKREAKETASALGASLESSWLNMEGAFYTVLRAMAEQEIPGVGRPTVELKDDPTYKWIREELGHVQEQQIELASGIEGEVQRAIFDVANAYSSMGLALGAFYITKNPTVAAGLLGALEGVPTYNDAIDAGKTPAEALLVAGTTTAGIVALEGWSMKMFLKNATNPLSRTINKAFTGFVVEGGQEAAQSGWQNLIARIGYDKTQKLSEGILQSFLIGGLVGGTSAAVVGVVNERSRSKAVQVLQKEGLTPEQANALVDDLISYGGQQLTNLAGSFKEQRLAGYKPEGARPGVNMSAALPGKELQPLYEEAKGKTLEEFLKAQGDTYYHGTDKTFANIDFAERKLQGIFGADAPKSKVIFLAEDSANAEFFASWKGSGEGRVLEYNIPKNAKILEARNGKIDWDLLEKIDKKSADLVNEGSATMQQIVDDPVFVKNLKKSGYDAVKLTEPEGRGTTLAVVNKDIIKTKSQLTDIWNEANKTTTEASLISEAKGKTLEEFVKAQPTVYHGTNAEFETFEGGKLGVKVDTNGGFYFSPYKDVAKNFGKNIKEVVLDIKNPKIAKTYREIGTLKKADIEQAIKEGYDGYYFKPSAEDLKSGYMKPYNEEWVAFKPEQIKTKSQLTDIWNEANKTTPETSLIEEAKGKTLEEFWKAEHTLPLESLNIGVTYKDWLKEPGGGMPSLTPNEPITVIMKDGKNLIADGVHRYFEHLNAGKKTIKVKYSKSQITDIWNEANKTTTEASLISEAKGKTLEEFVKAQGLAFEREIANGEKRLIIDIFPNEAIKGKGITKSETLNAMKNALNEGHTIIEPSNGLWTKQGKSFIEKIKDDGFIKQIKNRGGIERYEILPKIKEYNSQSQLTDIWEQENQKLPKTRLPENNLAFMRGPEGKLGRGLEAARTEQQKIIQREADYENAVMMLEGFTDNDLKLFAQVKNLMKKHSAGDIETLRKRSPQIINSAIEKVNEAVGYEMDSSEVLDFIEQLPTKREIALLRPKEGGIKGDKIAKQITGEFDARTPLEKAKQKAKIKLLGERIKRRYEVLGVKEAGKAKVKSVRELHRFNEVVKQLKKIPKDKINKLRPEYKAAIEDMVIAIKAGGKTQTKITGVNEVLNGIKELETEGIEILLPEDFAERLRWIEGSIVSDIPLSELEMVKDVVKGFIHQSNMKNTLIAQEKYMDSLVAVDQMLSDIETTSKIKPETGIIDSSAAAKAGSIFATYEYVPETMVEVMTGKDGGAFAKLKGGKDNTMFQIMYNAIDKGVSKQLEYSQSFVDSFNEFNSDGRVDPSWSVFTSPSKSRLNRLLNIAGIKKSPVKTTDYQNVVLSDGRQVKLTKAERVSLYMHSKHSKNLTAITEGGIAFDSNKTKIHQLSLEDLEAIVRTLTPAEKSFADEFVPGALERNGDIVADTFLEINGYDWQRVSENYYPLKFLEIRKPIEKHFQKFTLEGQGFLKARKEGLVKKPILIEDAFKVLNNSIEGSSAYIGLAKPIRDARIILSNPDFKAGLNELKGTRYYDFLENYVNDVEGGIGSKMNDVDKFAHSLKDNFVLSVLGNNPFVMAKQSASAPLALTEGNITTADLTVGAKRVTTDYDRIKEKWSKRSPQLRARFESGFNKDVVEAGGRLPLRGKLFGKTGLKEKQMAGITYVDTKTVLAIAEGVEKYLKKNYPGIDQATVTQIVEENVRRTQPTFHPKDRSQLSRSEGFLARFYTMFTSATNKILNINTRNYYKAKRGGSKKEALKNVFIASVVSSLIISAIDRARDELYGREWSWLDFLTDVPKNAAGTVYFLGSIYNKLESTWKKGKYMSYDFDNPFDSIVNSVLDTVGDATEVGKNLLEGKDTEKQMEYLIDDAVKAGSYVSGTGINSVKKIVESLFKDKKRTSSTGSKWFKSKSKTKWF